MFLNRYWFLLLVFFCIEFKMSTEGQRVDDSPSTSGGSSDGDQRESIQQDQEREQVQPKKKEGKISSKTAAKLSTSAKRYLSFFNNFLLKKCLLIQVLKLPLLFLFSTRHVY